MLGFWVGVGSLGTLFLLILMKLAINLNSSGDMLGFWGVVGSLGTLFLLILMKLAL